MIGLAVCLAPPCIAYGHRSATCTCEPGYSSCIQDELTTTTGDRSDDGQTTKGGRQGAMHVSGSQLTARTRHAILSYPIPMCVAGAGRLDRARGGRGAGQGKSYCRRNRRRRRRWPLSRRPIRCWRCAVAALMMNFESGTEHASGRVIEEKKP